MVSIRVDFDDLLDVIDQLSPEQKRILRQHLDEDWARRFGEALADVRADMPIDICAEELDVDVQAAIVETRHSNQVK